ncbi:hypothetical protein H9P43_006411 [Blastocladiella emersonii ATCC 22665]|nr:hypothetical protein H9P43_006411 [Blastocladiella emersonii ATCC 22665]
MAQLASCKCGNVTLQLAEAADTAFEVQDGRFAGYSATCVPHSIQVEYPTLTSVHDPDACRMKWLECGNCRAVVYGVERDDEQSLPLLLPLDHKLVLTRAVLVGHDAEQLRSAPTYSPLYKVLVPQSRSFGPNRPGAELDADLRAVLAQLDAVYSAHVARETAATEARIAAMRDAELAKLKRIDDQAANARDCLFASVVRFRHHVDDEAYGTPASSADAPPAVDQPDSPTTTPPSTSRSRSRTATGPNGVADASATAPPLLVGSLLGRGTLPLSLASTAAATAAAAGPATAVARNGRADELLSASLVPESELSRAAAASADARPARRRRTLTAPSGSSSRPPPSSSDADDSIFAFDDDEEEVGEAGEGETVAPPQQQPEPVSEADEEDEDEEDASPVDVETSRFGTSLPLAVPLVRSRTVSGRGPAIAEEEAGAPAPPLPIAAGDEDETDAESINSANPPHAFLAKTYAPKPGAFLVGSKPPSGDLGRQFSFKY